jgi:hypothetical protein
MKKISRYILTKLLLFLPLALKLSQRLYGLKSSEAMNSIEGEIESNNSQTEKTLRNVDCSLLFNNKVALHSAADSSVITEFTTKQHTTLLLFFLPCSVLF